LKFGPMVLRRCRRLLHDEQEALDAMQDTFVRLLRYGDTLEENAPSSLLFKMATNVCLNRIRQGKSAPEPLNAQALLQIAALADHEGRFVAGNLLGRLFQKEKEGTGALAVMHFLDGMTFEEVAAASGMSVSGVRKRLSKLRSGLDAVMQVEQR